MKLTVTIAAALIGLAAAFGPAGMAQAGSLPEGAPVVLTGGGHHGGWHRRDGYRGSYRSGRRHDRRGYRRHNRDHGSYAPRRHHRHRGHGHDHGRRSGRGHNAGPYVLGGVALGTFLFLNALEGH